MRAKAIVTWCACAVTGVTVAGDVSAQATTLETRIAAAPADGDVRMSFAARPDVCGEGSSITTHGRNRTVWRSSSSDDIDWDEDCEHGPVRVVLRLHGHTPVALRAYVGGRWREPRPQGPRVTDLGAVPAGEAAAYLIRLARQLPAPPGSDTVFPATLADSATVWPALAALARDSSIPSATRKQSVFWLGQAAGDATASLDSLAEDRRVDEDVREQAVFALSQRPHDEGVPALIRIAKANTDPALRRKALFWLGQSGDSRAIDVFEEILTKRP
jgi:HEAT repeat protein